MLIKYPILQVPVAEKVQYVSVLESILPLKYVQIEAQES
jgi:hypothetical protein